MSSKKERIAIGAAATVIGTAVTGNPVTAVIGAAIGDFVAQKIGKLGGKKS